MDRRANPLLGFAFFVLVSRKRTDQRRRGVAHLSEGPIHNTHPISEALLSVIEPVLRVHGVEPFEITLKRESMGLVLRVMIEVPGTRIAGDGVTLDLITEVSRDLSRALDVSDPITAAYTLEVSSPGIERPLRSVAEFERFSGQPAKVYLNAARADGQKVLRGKIERVEGEQIVMICDGHEQTLTWPEIKSAHLVFEFGNAERPGKSGKGGQKTAKKGAKAGNHHAKGAPQGKPGSAKAK